MEFLLKFQIVLNHFALPLVDSMHLLSSGSLESGSVENLEVAASGELNGCLGSTTSINWTLDKLLQEHGHMHLCP